MKTLMYTFIVMLSFSSLAFSAGNTFESDTIKTASGDLVLTFIGHGTLMLTCADVVIHVDPVKSYADYTKMPRADLILVTHDHGDHLDTEAIEQVTKSGTTLIVTRRSAEKVEGGVVLNNGEKKKVLGILIEAVPAYNLQHKREDGSPFHAKGEGNGYVISFGGKRVYIAGDTENIPEMAQLKNIDIAFLPMNLPYTMTPEMVASATRLFHPKILYPYHYGKTDVSKLTALLKAEPNLEIRIRKMQ
ncbi:MAG: MBL fold metallo-hydrolase [Calditrichales bacterium]|nr:MAG: MBL fold metallo-hydrolase [Calditrichales bacterium]